MRTHLLFQLCEGSIRLTVHPHLCGKAYLKAVNGTDMTERRKKSSKMLNRQLKNTRKETVKKRCINMCFRVKIQESLSLIYTLEK